MITNISISPAEKIIRVFTDNVTKDDLKSAINKLQHFDMYEIRVHNKNQQEDLIDTYTGNVTIDNLYKLN